MKLQDIDILRRLLSRLFFNIKYCILLSVILQYDIVERNSKYDLEIKQF